MYLEGNFLKVKFVPQSDYYVWGSKKLHIIEEILKIQNGAVLAEVETVIAKSKLHAWAERVFLPLPECGQKKKRMNSNVLYKKVANKSIRMIGNNSNKCMLDTSIIIHAFRENNAIPAQLDALEETYIPFFVVGEFCCRRIILRGL